MQSTRPTATGGWRRRQSAHAEEPVIAEREHTAVTSQSETWFIPSIAVRIARQYGLGPGPRPISGPARILDHLRYLVFRLTGTGAKVMCSAE